MGSSLLTNIKSLLKRIPSLNAINAWGKTNQFKRCYRETFRYCAGGWSQRTVKSLLIKRCGDRMVRLKSPKPSRYVFPTFWKKNKIDLAIISAPERVELYLKEDYSAIFLPEGSDPEIFNPMPNKAKIYDVSFIGGKYDVRDKFIETLQKEGISVGPFGSRWSNGRVETENKEGKLNENFGDGFKWLNW